MNDENIAENSNVRRNKQLKMKSKIHLSKMMFPSIADVK